MIRRLALLLLVGLLALPNGVFAQSSEVVVILVRHAERAEDGTSDPPISEEGWARARIVAAMLQDSRLTHIYSTDFKRTRSTAEPTATATGLTVESYDPRDLAGFAAQLRRTPGRHLVVGHSNTTGELAAALGGDAVSPIQEMEYDRGYVVVVLPSGKAGSAIFRYGDGGR